MIAPTGRTIVLIAIGAPVALLLGLFEPAYWIIAPAWIAFCLAAFLFDLLTGPSIAAAGISVDAPAAVGVGESFPLSVAVATGGTGRPLDARLSLSADPRIAPNGRLDALLMPPAADDEGNADGVTADLTLHPVRRGIAAVERAWISWTGPLGLARKQRSVAIDREIAIVPSIRAVREEGAALFSRDAQIGQRLNARLGEGSEFESLVRFMPGLDRRAIDWKQSARHTDLLAKQFETERDNRIVMVIDSGRMMSEPVVTPDGLAEPRLDRAVSAALTLAYVALRLEDRVSLASFAARPKLSSREYTRLSDFAQFRRAASDIDYAFEESNYTLGLASIGAMLKRRALLVIFTEFADATSAELMIRAASRLVAKHLVLFVVLADNESEGICAAVPDSAEAMTAATIAAELLRDRRVVLGRLRRMGALVVEAPASGMSASLLATYIRVKRQGLI
jgi:uncharacterized protein (DUF58 family)